MSQYLHTRDAERQAVTSLIVEAMPASVSSSASGGSTSLPAYVSMFVWNREQRFGDFVLTPEEKVFVRLDATQARELARYLLNAVAEIDS